MDKDDCKEVTVLCYHRCSQDYHEADYNSPLTYLLKIRQVLFVSLAEIIGSKIAKFVPKRKSAE